MKKKIFVLLVLIVGLLIAVNVSAADDDGKNYSSCRDFGKFGKAECENNKYYSCMWVNKDKISYCNYDNLTYVKCGDSWDIPDKLPNIISFIVNFIKIVTPIILVFVSILSLVKAVASQKEDELKKAQSILVKRLIAAALVFFIIQITQFVMFKVADDEDEVGNMSTCFSCLLNNNCSKNRYFKTMVGGKYECTYLSDTSSHYDCEDNTKIEYSDNSSSTEPEAKGSYSGGGTKLPDAEGSYSGEGTKLPDTEGSYSGEGTKLPDDEESYSGGGTKF